MTEANQHVICSLSSLNGSSAPGAEQNGKHNPCPRGAYTVTGEGGGLHLVYMFRDAPCALVKEGNGAEWGNKVVSMSQGRSSS